jgi:hypothetical protein
MRMNKNDLRLSHVSSSLALREDLHRSRLDDARRALAFLPRQRSRYGESDARTRLDDFLVPQPPRACDPHALRERLVHDILQQPLLGRDVERQRVARRRARGVRRLCRGGSGRDGERGQVRGGGCAHMNMDDGRGRVRGYRDTVDALEDGAHHVDVFLQRAKDRGCVAKDVDAL